MIHQNKKRKTHPLLFLREEGDHNSLFSNKFFGLFLVIIATLLISVNAIWLFPSLQTIETTITQNHLAVAQRAREATEHFFYFNTLRLKTLTNDIGSEPQRVHHFLEVFIRDNTDFQELIFIDNNGFEQDRVSQFSFTFPDKESRLEATGISIAVLGEQYISPIYFQRGEPLTSIFLPVMNEKRKIVGVLEAHLRFRAVWNFMATISRESGRHVYLVDSDGNIIADPDPSIVLKRENVLSREIIQDIVGNTSISQSDFFQRVYSDESKTSIFSVGIPYKDFGWGVFVETPSKEVFSTRNQIILLFSIGTLALFIIIIWSFRKIINLINTLDQKRRQTDAIISNLTDGLVQYDREFKILLVNGTAEQQLGIKESDLIGKIIHPNDMKNKKLSSLTQIIFPILGEDSHKVKTSPKDKSMGIELKISYPVARDLQVLTVPIMNEFRETDSYLKVIRDVTYEKLIARTKTEFISLAAHQLRTPLSALRWIMHGLLNKEFGNLTGEQTEYIGKALFANDRMINLVSGLLSVARIEEGRFGYSFKKGEIIPAIEEVIENNKELAKKLKVDLSLRILSQKISPIIFDKEHLQFALSNLIDNAIRYSRSDIRNSFVEVSVRDLGNFFEIEVKDNGIGIPEKYIPRLFEKFSRAPNAKKKDPGGSGLGLFIVKNIILNHGGDIKVQSTINEGTRFIFTLSKDPPRELSH